MTPSPADMPGAPRPTVVPLLEERPDLTGNLKACPPTPTPADVPPRTDYDPVPLDQLNHLDVAGHARAAEQWLATAEREYRDGRPGMVAAATRIAHTHAALVAMHPARVIAGSGDAHVFGGWR